MYNVHPLENVTKIALCGIIAGVLSAFGLMAFVAVSIPSGAEPSGQPLSGPGFFLIDIAAGLGAMWLYVTLRAQMDRVAAIFATTLVWWACHNLLTTVSAGFSPATLTVMGVTALIVCLAVSTAVFAYETRRA